MRIEHAQLLQQIRRDPGKRHEAAGEGRGQGDPAEVEGTAGEQAPDLGRADAAGLAVGRVQPEVLPHGEPANLSSTCASSTIRTENW